MGMTLPAGIKVDCTLKGRRFEASVWDGAIRIAVEEAPTRLSAIRAATESYWVQRIATAQLLTEELQ